MKGKFTRLREFMEDYELQQEDRRIELRMYKVRWIWYHTILGLLMFFANIILIAIFLLLAIKL